MWVEALTNFLRFGYFLSSVIIRVDELLNLGCIMFKLMQAHVSLALPSIEKKQNNIVTSNCDKMALIISE